jgi:hypothetical protein
MNRRPSLSRHRPIPHARERERGAVAIVVGLLIVVLVGFIGLALDGGHLYLTKTELQNSADACALAASYDLAGAPVIPAAAFPRAEAAGRMVGKQNKVDFQGSAITDADITVAFGTTLSAGGIWTSAGAASPTSKYVRCTITRGGIAPYFMGVLGFGTQTVQSLATATLAPAQTNCGIPLGMCRVGAATATDVPPFGLVPGQWYSGRFKDGGGNWNWIDYDPPSGGLNELAALLVGNGRCSLDVTNKVGQPGVLGDAAAKAWNTRFGLYQGGYDVTHNAPDFTGHAYTSFDWLPGSNALIDFVAKRGANTPYGSSVANGNAISGLSISNAYNPTITIAQHVAYGADRRLVVSPIIDCAALAGGTHTTTVLGWGCVLMLQPIANPGDTISMEYEGLSSAAGSPCATSGVVGSTTSVGPMVPALTQ